ncbi:MAG: holo-ACP synthase [Erysipelotrichaceae bacterium]|nr:holo-ACP synthase [Erysipelotrichaceae bacterium]
MIVGIGCDIVDLARINVDDDRLAVKVLSEPELEIYRKITNKNIKRQYLGTRFSVKESFYKATSHLNLEHTYKSLTLLNDENGRPFLNYPNAHVSISHEKQMAITYVVVENIE